MRVDEDGNLATLIDVTNLIVEKSSIDIKTNDLYASCTNGNNKQHNRSIHNINRAGIIDSNQDEKKCCFTEET